MKKILSLFLLVLLSFPIVNVYSISSIYTADLRELYQIDLNGNVLNQVTGITGIIEELVVDDLDNVYISTRDGIISKYNSTLNLIWTNTNHTSDVRALAVDPLGNVYSGSFDNTVRKFDSNGNQLWSFTGHTNAVQQVAVSSNSNIYSVSSDSTLRKINSNGQQQWVVNIGSITPDVVVDQNENIYTFSFDSKIRKYDSAGNLIWSVTSPSSSISLEINLNDEIYALTKGAPSEHFIYNIDKSNGNITTIYSMVNPDTTFSGDIVIDVAGNIYFSYERFNRPILTYEYFLDTIVNGVVTNSIQTNFSQRFLSLPYEITEPDTYEVNLSNNYSPYTDFIYTDNNQTITGSTINTIIDNDESWSVTDKGIDLSPFTFNFWYDLDNNQVFSNDFAININDPNRDYNLSANFSLNNAVSLELDSNLPSPPNFELVVDTIQNNTGAIIQYPINEQIPFGFNYQVLAPTNNIGFYEFDYWYDNDNQRVYSNNPLLTGAGINDFNLTATYSLPEEYQINLTLESQVGVISFQHGNLDPITGTVISVTIGENDTWSATAPSNPNFQFNNWVDLDTSTNFSNDQTIGISNTTKNYNLMATYFELVEIEWNSNGGTPIPNQKVVIGTSVNAPNDPIRPQFVFNGWENPQGQIQTFPVNISSDITFTALWLDTYTLTYDVNGGGRIKPDTYIDQEIPEVVTPSRFGYTFEGWFTDDGTFQNSYDFTDPITQDTTIHAKWAFGSDRDAELSLTTFLNDNDLGDRFSQIIVMITIYVFVNIVIMIYQAPLIVTLILNFIVTSLFMILGWIAIWLVVVIFMALFGFLYFTSSGRGLTE